MRGDRRRHRARVRRRRLVLAGAVVLVVVGVVVVTSVVGGGTAPSGHPGSTAPGSTAPGSTAPGSTAPGSSGSTVPAGPASYAVGTDALPLVEPVGGGSRALPTAVRYPAVGAPGVVRVGAEPDRKNGPYPLVVFSQGYDLAPEDYHALLEEWAAAGYVVADPEYPHTSPGAVGGLDEYDMVNHPADLRFVITRLLRASSASGNVLSGLVDPNEVAVVGHSDGGDVSLALAANASYRDPVVKAAMILSGAEWAPFGGRYYTAGSVPLLVVQGTADTVNPPACSVQVYDGAPGPKYYVTLLGASHEPPYLDPGPSREVVGRVTIAFLDAYLKGSTAARARIATAGSSPGVATVSSAASLPYPGGSCPDAPG